MHGQHVAKWHSEWCNNNAIADGSTSVWPETQQQILNKKRFTGRENGPKEKSSDSPD